MRFYLTFGFLGFKVVQKRTMNFSKVVKISDFRILSSSIEKYKSALSKSDSSWDNSCCVRLVIVSLAVNIGKLQSLVCEDNFFCWVYNAFCNDFLSCNVIDFVRMWKLMGESCVEKNWLSATFTVLIKLRYSLIYL